MQGDKLYMNKPINSLIYRVIDQGVFVIREIDYQIEDYMEYKNVDNDTRTLYTTNDEVVRI